ncbi:hypothetical protein AP460_02552 [Actinobacillus pleuropneumoniae]|uniref:hypothetical protein n=1 Tax=Actinobacillus pleuropneumoniae TaxID=715 RepID=UPI00058478D5|nr:hypothetical protein [Actinobacillus pleuropneumoniae]KIE87625.1 hypothetical protein AP1022_02601 [Actinobacillus pleuropneumoniae]KIE87642.1 hypothetical protein AP460_02552 [Actinobacillus pleuropneumoniae]KIE87728.1 hypothetical protein AP518_02639 [Actinobacillus pleuropneumoniae]KIE93996.1 hypothetical protein AP5651_02648 [Actinobacillus pleuropneumoniae]KIE94616.1 hypothetical protein AP597_02557 [Actinobacillus pleuropneumoniae]
MANITLKDITPRHFYETVKLLKTGDCRIYITLNTLEIRLPYSDFESGEETQLRFDRLEHAKLFLEELVNSSVPIDWDEFIANFRYKPRHKFYK